MTATDGREASSRNYAAVADQIALKGCHETQCEIHPQVNSELYLQAPSRPSPTQEKPSLGHVDFLYDRISLPNPPPSGQPLTWQNLPLVGMPAGLADGADVAQTTHVRHVYEVTRWGLPWLVGFRAGLGLPAPRGP